MLQNPKPFDSYICAQQVSDSIAFHISFCWTRDAQLEIVMYLKYTQICINRKITVKDWECKKLNNP
jgi:hypothetical protein